MVLTKLMLTILSLARGQHAVAVLTIGSSPVDFRYRVGVVPECGGSAAAMAKAQFTPAHTRAALVSGG